jgi:diaminopimelate decarboxylase
MLTRDERGAVLGGVPLAETLRQVASGGVGTPAYVYDLDGIEAEARALAAGFDGAPHLVAYAVKANSAGPVVRALGSAGCGGEVVSGGELAVALGSGIDAERILFSGVAKQAWEIDAAIAAGARGILAIQLESVEEVARVEARAAALGRRVRVSVRVNPGIATDTHAHVATGHDAAKFGIPRADLDAAWEALSRSPHLDLVGLGGHVGSQLTRPFDYLTSAEIMLGLAVARRRAGAALTFVDFGGGFGVDYGSVRMGETPEPPAQPVPSVPTRPTPKPPADFARAVARLVADSELAGLCIVIEPGRSLVAAHGVLCATVIGAKRSGERRWLMIDAGMNDLLRPALYAAWHRIEPLEGPVSLDAPCWRVVGPVCESSDDFGAHPFASPPDGVVIRDAGAYGFTMASQYNGRALPAEVFLRGGRIAAISVPRRVEDWVAQRLSVGGGLGADLPS